MAVSDMMYYTKWGVVDQIGTDTKIDHVSSVESQKGFNATQKSFIENQKGAIATYY